LIGSLLPRKSSPLVNEPLLGEVDSTQPAAGSSADLYGPVMLCFTLASLLQLGLKLANVSDLVRLDNAIKCEIHCQPIARVASLTP